MERFRSAYVSELDTFVAVVAARAESPSVAADALEAFYAFSVPDPASPRDSFGGTGH